MLGISHESSVVMAPKRTKTSSSPASSSVTAPCSAGERDLLIFNSVTGGQIVLKPGEQFSPINRAFVQGKFEPSLEMNNNGTITKVTFAWLAGVFLSGDMVLVTGPIPLSLRFVSGAKLTLMVEGTSCAIFHLNLFFFRNATHNQNYQFKIDFEV